MPDRPDSPDSISLRAYFERLVESCDEKHTLRNQMSERALDVAHRALATRLESMNEIRDAMRDQSSHMATKIELAALRDIVDDLRLQKSNLDGRIAVAVVAMSFAVNGILWAIFTLFSR
jgi:hypothetical protein